MEISGKIAQELQLLQDAFAGLVKLSLVITNSDGSKITNPSSPPDHHPVFEKEILGSFVSRSSEITKTDSAFIVDAPYSPIQGVKCILAPIRLAAGFYFLWAGPFLTKGSIVQLPPEQNHFKEDLNRMAETSSDEIARRLQKVEEAASFIQKTFATDAKQKKMQQQYRLIERLVSQFERKDFFREAAEHLLKDDQDMSFLGCAKRTGSYQYQITELYGDYNEHLLQSTFLSGEGFLGQAASSGQFLVWNHLKDDSRAAIFSKNTRQLRSLFCFQLNQEDAVVFGGSFFKSVDEELTQFLRIICSLFLHHQSQSQLRQEITVSQTRLNILKDISMILSEIKDINRVLYILMDMSINLVKGRFTCVYLHQNEYVEQSKMVSRGLRQEQISAYGSSLKKKFFEKESFIRKEADFIHMPWQEAAFEYPLLQDDEVIGVFCVGMADEQEFEEFSPLLTSFAQLAGFSLRLLLPKKGKAADDEKIRMLYEAAGQFNKPAYQRISEVSKVLQDFCTYLEADEKTRQLCEEALLLTPYRAEFLEKQGISKKIARVVDEYYLLQEGGQKEPVSLQSQMIYLGLTHFHDDQNDYPETIDPELTRQFDAFLLKTEAKETIIPDTDRYESRAGQPNLKGIKSQFSLSEREEEVLDLMIKGSNNKEIGDQLFISEHTVKNHLTNIFRKLNVKDRAQAIAKYYSYQYK